MTRDNVEWYPKEGELRRRICKKCQRRRAAEKAERDKARRRAVPNKGIRDCLDAMWDALKRDEQRHPTVTPDLTHTTAAHECGERLGKVGPKAAPTRPDQTKL
jgi:hypothetical protein